MNTRVAFENNTSKPFFSVIIPVYNAEKYVGRALDSVLAQSFTDFEVILVDDGSTDGSADVIEKYNDPRVRLIRQENRGEGGARNRGIEDSSGEWLTFLDADDEWTHNFLSERYKVIISQDNVDFCYSSYRCIRSDGHSFSGIKYNSITSLLSSNNLFDNKMFIKYRPCIGTIAVRRSILEQTGLFPIGMKIGTDIHLIMRLLFVSRTSVFIPQEHAMYYYDIGVMAKNTAEKKRQRKASHYPATLLAVEEWETIGKIPPERRKSVRRFVERDFIPWFIYQKGFDRAYGVAWRMLRRHISLIRHPICYFKAVISFSCGWIRSFDVLRSFAKILLQHRSKNRAGK